MKQWIIADMIERKIVYISNSKKTIKEIWFILNSTDTRILKRTRTNWMGTNITETYYTYQYKKFKTQEGIEFIEKFLKENKNVIFNHEIKPTTTGDRADDRR